MPHKISVLYFIIISFLLSSCSTFSKPSVSAQKKEMRIYAKIYSLSNGEVIDIVTRKVGNGKTKLVKSSKTKSGETFQGEFITMNNSISSSVNVSASSSNGISVSGNGYSRLNSDGNPGTGILIGSKGTVININYIISRSSKNSVGTGIDNRGHKYKFTCCDIKYLN